MEKYTWRAVIKEGMKEEYIRRHDTIWPEMVEVLKEAGVCNYTIWCDGNDLFGYYECEKRPGARPEGTGGERSRGRWDISMEPIMTMFQEKPEQVFFLE